MTLMKRLLQGRQYTRVHDGTDILWPVSWWLRKVASKQAGSVHCKIVNTLSDWTKYSKQIFQLIVSSIHLGAAYYVFYKDFSP